MRERDTELGVQALRMERGVQDPPAVEEEEEEAARYLTLPKGRHFLTFHTVSGDEGCLSSMFFSWFEEF